MATRPVSSGATTSGFTPFWITANQQKSISRDVVRLGKRFQRSRLRAAEPSQGSFGSRGRNPERRTLVSLLLLWGISKVTIMIQFAVTRAPDDTPPRTRGRVGMPQCSPGLDGRCGRGSPARAGPCDQRRIELRSTVPRLESLRYRRRVPRIDHLHHLHRPLPDPLFDDPAQQSPIFSLAGPPSRLCGGERVSPRKLQHRDVTGEPARTARRQLCLTCARPAAVEGR
jgi:hypothetical protein